MLNYKKDKVMATTLNFREVSIKNEVKNNGREAKLIAKFSGRILPKLQISAYTIDLFNLQQRLNNLKDGSILVFGRSDEFCDIIVSNYDRTVSRIHCYIRKNGNGFELFDCSLNGTQVIL